MLERAEALTHLARLLGDDGLRAATPEAAAEAVRSGSQRLAENLVREVAESDDVFDRASALSYLEQRLASLSEVIPSADRETIASLAREAIERW